MIHAGDLRHTITFYGRTDQKESTYGSVDDTFAQGITCRAKVTQLGGAETVLSNTIANRTVIQFLIRYRTGIDEKMQIAWEGNRYDIEVIEQDAKHTQLLITTTKIVNE